MSIDCVNGRTHDDHGYDRGLCSVCHGQGCTSYALALQAERDALAKRVEKMLGPIRCILKACSVHNEWPVVGTLTLEQERQAMDDFVVSTRDILMEALAAAEGKGTG